jgi:hypothetical protein
VILTGCWAIFLHLGVTARKFDDNHPPRSQIVGTSASQALELVVLPSPRRTSPVVGLRSPNPRTVFYFGWCSPIGPVAIALSNSFGPPSKPMRVRVATVNIGQCRLYPLSVLHSMQPCF